MLDACNDTLALHPFDRFGASDTRKEWIHAEAFPITTALQGGMSMAKIRE